MGFRYDMEGHFSTLGREDGTGVNRTDGPNRVYLSPKPVFLPSWLHRAVQRVQAIVSGVFGRG